MTPSESSNILQSISALKERVPDADFTLLDSNGIVILKLPAAQKKQAKALEALKLNRMKTRLVCNKHHPEQQWHEARLTIAEFKEMAASVLKGHSAENGSRRSSASSGLFAPTTLQVQRKKQDITRQEVDLVKQLLILSEVCNQKGEVINVTTVLTFFKQLNQFREQVVFDPHKILTDLMRKS